MIGGLVTRTTLWRFFVGAGVVLLIGLGTLAVLYRAELKRTASQALEIAGYRQTIGEQSGQIEGLREQIERERRIAGEHRARADRRAAEARALEARIAKLLEDNDEARDWWNTRIPDPLLGELRPGAGGADQDREDVPAAGVPGADPSAGNGGRHEWFFVPFGGGAGSGD